MSAKAKTYSLRLTEAELKLVYDDFQGALGVGASEEEPLWQTVFDKVARLRAKIEAAATGANHD